ncbi:hypothetical protein EV182_007091, partial [Spiromyces aspiralis]
MDSRQLTRSINVPTLQQLQAGILQKHPAVVIYFTSATCPPCHIIAPHFEDLLKEINHDRGRQSRGEYVVGVKVDCSAQFQIASAYQVHATPTFMFFHKGEK